MAPLLFSFLLTLRRVDRRDVISPNEIADAKSVSRTCLSSSPASSPEDSGQREEPDLGQASRAPPYAMRMGQQRQPP